MQRVWAPGLTFLLTGSIVSITGPSPLAPPFPSTSLCLEKTVTNVDNLLQPLVISKKIEKSYLQIIFLKEIRTVRSNSGIYLKNFTQF